MRANSQQIGKAGEELAGYLLRLIGVEMIESIATPKRMIPYEDERGNIIPGVFKVIFSEKVSGDWRGLLSGGRGVHCEVKVRNKERLNYSDLEYHQSAWLDEYAALGGVAVLIWVCLNSQFILKWPIPEFEPGTSLLPSPSAGCKAAYSIAAASCSEVGCTGVRSLP